jgi:hypothetical protein
MSKKNLNLARLPIPPRGLDAQWSTAKNRLIKALYPAVTFSPKPVPNSPVKKPLASLISDSF